MKPRRLWKKWLTLGLICLFLLACVVPALAAEEDEINIIYEEGTETSKEGNTISWKLANYGEDCLLGLFVYGTGAIQDYSPKNVFCTGSKHPGWRTPTKCSVNAISRVFVRSGITSIGTHAFSGLLLLGQVVLPDGLQEIGEYAFANNTTLVRVYIPDSVSVIADNAFYGCYNEVFYCSSTSYAAQYAAEHDIDIHYTDICNHESWSWVVTKEADCTNVGVKEKTCSDCGEILETEEIAATGHSYGSWVTVREATVLKAEKQKRTCSSCGKTKTRTVGEKLTPTIKVNHSSLLLKVKQSTTALKVSGLAKGDYVKSYTSADKKIATVTKKGKITAGSKTGSTKITIRLASGKTKKITVKVQKSAVAATKIRGVAAKLTMYKTQTKTLKPKLSPVTCVQKITYKSSNKSVATVNSKGKITAKKGGTATITVKAGKKTVKCKVTVENIIVNIRMGNP